MKKYSFLIFLICFTLVLNAQLINGDFEGGVYPATSSPTASLYPEGWECWSTVEVLTGDAFEGDHYVELTTVFGFPAEIYQTFSMPNITSSSLSLNFAYQSEIAAGDSALIGLFVSDTNQNDLLLYSAGMFIDSDKSTWTSISLPLEPIGNAIGDPNSYQISAQTLFYSGRSDVGPKNSNVLRLDAISLSNNLSIGENSISKKLTLYPNPFSISTTMKLPSEPHIMTIYNILGNKVREEQVIGTTIIERGDLTKGLYMIDVRSDTQSYSGKLLVD